MHSNKGYVLLITIIITLVLVLTTVATLTIVYRYTSLITNRINDLRQSVYNYITPIKGVIK